MAQSEDFADGPRPVWWIRKDDPRYSSLAVRWAREKPGQKPPAPITSKYFQGEGWAFPALGGMTDRTPLQDPVWYAVQTIPCRESVAAIDLRRAGFWVTYPLDRFQARQRRPLGRTLVRWIDRPHFPGYVFLALRYSGESLATVNDTRGVVRVVCRPLSGEPLTIPIPVMDAILAERLFSLDDERGAIVMSETHLHGDRELRVFLSSLGRWKTEPVHAAAV